MLPQQLREALCGCRVDDVVGGVVEPLRDGSRVLGGGTRQPPRWRTGRPAPAAVVGGPDVHALRMQRLRQAEHAVEEAD